MYHQGDRQSDESRWSDHIARFLSPDGPSFALLYRPHAHSSDLIDVLEGEACEPESLNDIPASANGDEPRFEALTVIPFRQIAERGFECQMDNSPLLAMRIDEHATVPVTELLDQLPNIPINLDNADFDTTDTEYGEIVQEVLSEEVGRGEGANFVIKRTFMATVRDYSPEVALTIFRRLLNNSLGVHWIFVVHVAGRTFVGASPERHVSLEKGTVTMNPISGTYRYPDAGPSLDGVVEFLGDQKEAEELSMVVDEELKMMSRICDSGSQVVGPYLKEMTKLAHTEYFLTGQTSLDSRTILRESLFAPTVTGSPLENACRVIKRYEPYGRGYYSGVLALLGQDEDGYQTLDSSILIRTAEFSSDGQMRIGTGATLVRQSSAENEATETRSKAAGLLQAIEQDGSERDTVSFSYSSRIDSHPAVRAELKRRNTTLSDFWLQAPHIRNHDVSILQKRSILVIDAEDTFTSMLRVQLASLGLRVHIRGFAEHFCPESYDLVLVGPGPGDPREFKDPKIAHLRDTTFKLLQGDTPFLAVCLGHQILSGLLGFDLARKSEPNQGRQLDIDLFGHIRRLGFYNTFTAISDYDHRDPGLLSGDTEVSRDSASREVYALRGSHFQSMQFHPESILSTDGLAVLKEVLVDLMSPAMHIAV